MSEANVNTAGSIAAFALVKMSTYTAGNVARELLEVILVLSRTGKLN